MQIAQLVTSQRIMSFEKFGCKNIQATLLNEILGNVAYNTGCPKEKRNPQLKCKFLNK